MKQLVALVLATLLVVGLTPGMAGAGPEESTFEEIGYGTGSVVGSAVYFPFKATFCILGCLASPIGLMVDGAKGANRVIAASCRGTWAITPDIVMGKEPVRFVGEPAKAKASDAARAEKNR